MALGTPENELDRPCSLGYIIVEWSLYVTGGLDGCGIGGFDSFPRPFLNLGSGYTCCHSVGLSFIEDRELSGRVQPTRQAWSLSVV